MAQNIHTTIAAARQALAGQNLPKDTLESILAALQQASEDDHPKWWLILLKTLAYLIGLLLAGYGTTAAAATIVPQLFV